MGTSLPQNGVRVVPFSACRQTPPPTSRVLAAYALRSSSARSTRPERPSGYGFCAWASSVVKHYQARKSTDSHLSKLVPPLALRKIRQRVAPSPGLRQAYPIGTIAHHSPGTKFGLIFHHCDWCSSLYVSSAFCTLGVIA